MIKIIHITEPDMIEFSMKLAKIHDINVSKLIIKIGVWVREMFVRINDELPEDTIGIPIELKQSFTLPEELSYEIVIKNRYLTIGPLIAFLAYRGKKNMSPQKLELFKHRFKNYKKINGLVFICAAKGINPSTKTIEGYYYNPNGKNPETRWIYGVFPYPNTVYKRKLIKGYRYNDLISSIGDRIINSFFFLKADIAKMSQQDKNFQKYFPYTEMLDTEEQLSKLIKHYHVIYIKPSNGRQGIGIYKVTMDLHGNYQFMDRMKKVLCLGKGEQLNKFLNKCKGKNYIIQQGIESLVNNQQIDFRVYAQKNKMGQWVCQGMIGRLAKKGAVVTNLYFTEKLLPGLEAIKTIFNTDHAKAIKIQGEIYKQCIAVCEELDKKFGNNGDVAIDVIVDANQRVWILEINKDFGYRSLVKLKNRKLLRTLYTTPFEYAKTLAGF
ncbi:YheC/YheD family protein [Neobacillus sp. WH10]|uniref:YheC/YheD family endospore coat-associated protein n=1 Tax=Neobacillus sp. WH10 TaxID=3047873 RepID=UPI0024C1EA36|nr:YheC/YheD family protein [Neobacillus sp. WH10]WHY78272.1 YheC/YheD family protein [Neobacillus sp. WH10]